jgi:hypothetical protein
VLQARLEALTDDTPPPRLLEPPAPPQPGISEEAFQALIVDLAERFRWLVIHNADSRRTEAGVPDLLLLGGPSGRGCLWWELKKQGGRVRPEQAAMGERLLRCGQRWAILRPSDWDEIVTTLTREG